jgi:hypothetical protein
MAECSLLAIDETLRTLKTCMPRTAGQSGRVVAELGRIAAASAAKDEQRQEVQGA